MKYEIEPTQSDYAATVAAAYAAQYLNDSGGMMGNPQIYFSLARDEFDYCSSLTPLSDSDVAIEEIEEGLYGDPKSADDIEVYLMSNSSLFEAAVDLIDAANEDEE